MEEYLGRDEIGIRHEIGLAKKFLQFDSSQKMRFLFAKGAPTEKDDLSEFLEKLLNGFMANCQSGSFIFSQQRG